MLTGGNKIIEDYPAFAFKNKTITFLIIINMPPLCQLLFSVRTFFIWGYNHIFKDNNNVLHLIIIRTSLASVDIILTESAIAADRFPSLFFTVLIYCGLLNVCLWLFAWVKLSALSSCINDEVSRDITEKHYSNSIYHLQYGSLWLKVTNHPNRRYLQKTASRTKSRHSHTYRHISTRTDYCKQRCNK